MHAARCAQLIISGKASAGSAEATPICDAVSGLAVQATIDAAFKSSQERVHVAIDGI